MRAVLSVPPAWSVKAFCANVSWIQPSSTFSRSLPTGQQSAKLSAKLSELVHKDFFVFPPSHPSSPATIPASIARPFFRWHDRRGLFSCHLGHDPSRRQNPCPSKSLDDIRLRHVTTAEILGQAMINVAQNGHAKRILETRDINPAARA
jgi:hypothetical protein